MKLFSVAKKILICEMLGVALIAGVPDTGIMPNTVSVAEAAPMVKLGYYEDGPYSNSVYSVDRGTLMTKGKMNAPKLVVTVAVEKNDTLKSVEYQFCQQNGVWKYMWFRSNGKDSGIWQSVSGNRLANDILYVITTR